jgi:AcrR family transcriptional regulator
MAPERRRLSPENRRAELLALGAEVFGQRPYDDVRIDEIAALAGVSRALMYHYFPDKRAFFAAVVRAESERLFEATNAAEDDPGQCLFERVRAGVLAYLRYDEQHPHGAWAAYVGIGWTDPVLRGIEDVDTDRQAQRIMSAIDAATAAQWDTAATAAQWDTAATAAQWDEDARRLLRATVYSWLAFTLEFCRQRIIDPSLDAQMVADVCAHALLDAIVRTPGLPADLIAAAHR